MSRVGLSCAIALFLVAQNGFPAEIQSHSDNGDDEYAAQKKQKNKDNPNDPVERVLERARALVPRSSGYEIVLIDPELAADPDRVRSLDAFIVRDDDGHLRPKIFINRESAIVRQAVRGQDFYISVLAAVIVHEIEHLKGGNEETARLAERQFFRTLIAEGHVAWSDGERYLALLQEQPERKR